MKLWTLAALVTVTTVGTTAHVGCATSTCSTEEQLTVRGRIENALKDLEIFNARAFATNARLDGRIEHALKDLKSATDRAFKADQERLKELERKAGIYR
jgi:hypothetical protein